MAKVFRFHEGASLKDWQVSSPLNGLAINAIKDPEGATAKKQITSIPSPFARIDLVRTAFKTIADSKELDGNTVFHKMISDAFDVGQIFFDYEKYSVDISIISWDKVTDLDKLINSSNESHRILGETLRLYLEQDGKVYNFNDLKRIFLLNFKNGPKPINIIGGSSPATLFFTSANDIKYTKLQSGNDVFFDEQFCPLYKREKEFIKYVYALKQLIPNFSSKFSFVNEYLELTYSKLDLDFRTELNPSFLEDWYNALPNLSIDGAHDTLEIIGFPIKMRANSTRQIEDSSDFTINPTKENFTGKMPLVLPNDVFAEKLKYTTDFWDLNYKAPFEDNLPLNERRLPKVNDKYPYLTVSDFLEPVLIRTILPVDSKFFFDGNLDKKENGFLLPIKPAFFDYFNAQDLSAAHHDGSNYFELKVLTNNSIEAILKVPIKNNKYITFRRVYNNPVNTNTLPQVNTKNNTGAIVENLFTVGLYPFVKFSNNILPDYRVALYEADYLPISQQNNYFLNFYDSKNNKIENIPSSSKRHKDEGSVSNTTYVLKDNFDFIQVSNNFGKGIFIPLFKEASGNEQFSFAIDFGTSNTHIEYRKGDSLPKPFEISSNEIQFAKSHIYDDKLLLEKANLASHNYILDYLNQDFVPQIIGSETEFSFPTRTVVYHHQNLDFNKTIYSFSDISLPLTYEKYAYNPNLRPRTNLKWAATNLENDKIINYYFEKLLFLVRTKILLNNGNIDKTKIIWFYPSSMSIHQQNILDEKWNSNVCKYFGQNVKVYKICESLAPFYYYTNVKGLSPALTKPIISIDMGGGTSDIVIYENNKANLLTSFKFAGNSIFGDDYGRSYSINGFVEKYYQRYLTLLETNKCIAEKGTLIQIRENGNSVDIVNALFSLQSNNKLINENISLNFIDDLKRDNEFKIIFLLYISSITYHVAKLMKEKNLKSPSDITFSGTASKLISILDSSSNLATFTKFINLIFHEFYDDVSVKIVFPENPKEITCKGGLYIDTQNLIDADSIKTIYSSNELYTKDNVISYKAINEDYLQTTILEFQTFISLFFNLNKKFSFNSNFGVNNDVIAFSQNYISENHENGLRQGLMSKEKDLGNAFDSEKISETLFFYPLIGVFGGLAYEINKNFGYHEIEN